MYFMKKIFYILEERAQRREMFEMPYTDYTTTLNGCNSFILR